jgi:hypothetical protein
MPTGASRQTLIQENQAGMTVGDLRALVARLDKLGADDAGRVGCQARGLRGTCVRLQVQMEAPADDE